MDQSNWRTNNINDSIIDPILKNLLEIKMNHAIQTRNYGVATFNLIFFYLHPLLHL